MPRPGEATLAHRGVLFADEFPEFHRDVINALREPLEDRQVSIARAKGSAIFPANFMLIAALNPCPCGFWGSARCKCMPHTIEKYRRKISGPVADRIDVWVHVGEMPPDIEELAMLSDKAESALVVAAKQMKLSPRGYHRTVKIARTIADLAGSNPIEPAHMLEALQYRAREI